MTCQSCHEPRRLFTAVLLDGTIAKLCAECFEKNAKGRGKERYRIYENVWRDCMTNPIERK